MMKHILYLLFFLSLNLSAQDENCEDPSLAGSQPAMELAAHIERVTEENFSDKFCKAFQACNGFQMKASQEAQKKQIEDHYKNLPDLIEKKKTEVAAARVKLGEMGPDDPNANWAKSSLEFAEKALADLEDEKKKYDLHLSDPSKYPHPMKEKGIGLTPEEMVVYQQQQQEKFWKSQFEALLTVPVPASSNSETLWSEIDTLAGQSPFPWSPLMMKFQEIFFSGAENPDLKLAQEYKADPSKLPEILKKKGIGLKPEEVPAFQEQQAETYFKGLSTQIQNQEKFIGVLQKKADALKTTDPHGELSMLEQWISSNSQQLSQQKQMHQAYLDHKQDPTKPLPPVFGMGLGGGYGFSGGYGAYLATNELPSMGGGLVGGMLGGSVNMSEGGECSEARMVYNSAVSTMESYGAGSCGMNQEEITALKYYSDSGYGCMNSYLRTDDNRDENIDYMIKVLNRGLDKLPSYQGIVKRGASLPESIREAHGVGAVIEYDAFTSTSTNSGFSGEDMFIIQSQTGKPIMGFSQHRSENEVLFKSGTKFKVLEKREENGVYHYILAEVPASGSSLPSVDSIASQATGSRSPASATEPDTYVCPVSGNAPVPQVLKQTNVPSFTFPGVAQ